jgi:tetratricopeptide (TPR) repeat protein
LLRLGQFEAAEFQYREILRGAPDCGEVRLDLARLLGALGRHQEALAATEMVIAHSEKMLPAYLLAASLEYDMGQYQAALARIEMAMAFAPDQPEVLTRRARILNKLGHDEAALAECNKVLLIVPNDAPALHAKALVLRSLNRSEEALQAFHSAELASTDPQNEIAVDRAWLLAEMGRKDAAFVVLNELLSSRPNSAKALQCRAFLTRHEPEHPDLAVMEKLVGKADISYCDRMRLSFSLGKAYLEIGDGAKAFSYLNPGNKLMRKVLNYDPSADGRRAAAIATVFSKEILSSLSGGGAQSTKPIFVFGMPRSGTTLVEQILASHPLVLGKGESAYLDTLAKDAIFRPALSGFTPEALASCGSRYLTMMGAAEPDSPYFVDKMTTNFLYAGLISLILPGARMIHCRRNALDTCLSCYSLLFADGHEFSYDLGELGHYYRLYRELMAHWGNVLPQGAILDIDYEALVGDGEGQIRRVLDFCGLPWNDACLRFYESNRLVATSSFDQVRRPLYKTSVGRAQMFRPWLGELEAALGQR